jgi:hypothetical protein
MHDAAECAAPGGGGWCTTLHAGLGDRVDRNSLVPVDVGADRYARLPGTSAPACNVAGQAPRRVVPFASRMA